MDAPITVWRGLAAHFEPVSLSAEWNEWGDAGIRGADDLPPVVNPPAIFKDLEDAFAMLLGLEFSYVQACRYDLGVSRGCHWHKDYYEHVVIVSFGGPGVFEIGRNVGWNDNYTEVEDVESFVVHHGDVTYLRPGFDYGWAHHIREVSDTRFSLAMKSGRIESGRYG